MPNIENTEINPHKYAQVIFNKDEKAMEWETSLFNKWKYICQGNWNIQRQNLNLKLSLTFCKLIQNG